MREILFRGKTVGTNKWVYGYGVGLNKSSFIIIGNGNYNVVIPETVSQYTGEKDKMKEKIFEGDIVKELTEVGVVRFAEGKFYIDWPTWRKHNFSESLYHHKDGCKVIGNIHDNPEMIK